MYLVKLINSYLAPDVSRVSAEVLNNTAVTIFWTPVNLIVVEYYTVYYTTVGGVNGTLTFPVSASSGVVSGLQEGHQYNFSVTVTLNVSGELFSGLPNFTQATTILSESLACIDRHVNYKLLLIEHSTDCITVIK